MVPMLLGTLKKKPPLKYLFSGCHLQEALCDSENMEREAQFVE
jgi:hypothetical protein